MEKAKKIIALVLSVVFILSFAMVSAFASNANSRTIYYGTGTYEIYARFISSSSTAQAETIMSCSQGNTVCASNQVMVIYVGNSYEYDMAYSNGTSAAGTSSYCSAEFIVTADTDDVAAIDSDHHLFYNGNYFGTESVYVNNNGTF